MLDRPPDSANANFRIGLLEIMLFVTATALALWSYDRTMIFQMARLPVTSTWQAVVQGYYLATAAVKLAGFLFLAQALLGRRKVLLQPGHAFLYAYGLTAAISIAGSFYVDLPVKSRIADLANMAIQPGHVVDSLKRVFEVAIAQGIIISFFSLVGVFKTRGYWRIAFLGLLFTTSLSLYLAFTTRISIMELLRIDPIVTKSFEALSSAHTLTNTFAIILISYCCVADRIRNRQRDWKHWLGIGLLVLDFYGTRALVLAAQSFSGWA